MNSPHESDQFLSFKETLEMFHLPCSHGKQDDGLRDGPPEDARVCAFAGLPEPFFPILEKTRKLFLRNIDFLETSSFLSFLKQQYFQYHFYIPIQNGK